LLKAAAGACAAVVQRLICRLRHDPILDAALRAAALAGKKAAVALLLLYGARPDVWAWREHLSHGNHRVDYTRLVERLRARAGENETGMTPEDLRLNNQERLIRRHLQIVREVRQWSYGALPCYLERHRRLPRDVVATIICYLDDTTWDLWWHRNSHGPCDWGVWSAWLENGRAYRSSDAVLIATKRFRQQPA